jgi:hypothetical protein
MFTAVALQSMLVWAQCACLGLLCGVKGCHTFLGCLMLPCVTILYLLPGYSFGLMSMCHLRILPFPSCVFAVHYIGFAQAEFPAPPCPAVRLLLHSLVSLSLQLVSAGQHPSTVLSEGGWTPIMGSWVFCLCQEVCWVCPIPLPAAGTPLVALASSHAVADLPGPLFRWRLALRMRGTLASAMPLHPSSCAGWHRQGGVSV